MSQERPIPLEGNLDGDAGEFDVPDLLLSVSHARARGRLDVSTGDAEKRIFLEEGRFTFASSSISDERLGIYLLKRNEIALADLRRLSRRVRPGLRLGALLVREGILDADRLVEAVLGQLQSMIIDLFGWTRASYRFLDRASASEESITLRVPTERLILDGIESVSSWERIARGLGSLDACFQTVAGNEDHFRSADLDTASLELLAMLGHPKHVEEICASTDLADIEVCRKLWAFRALGWIQTRPAAIRRSSKGSSTDEMDADLEGLGFVLGEGSRSEPD